MNQDSQKGVLHFTCDCLHHDLLLVTSLALWRLDHGQRRQQRWRWQQWQHSDGEDGGGGGNTTLQLHVQLDKHSSGSCIARVEIAYRVNTAGNEACFAAKVPCGFVLITRLSPHAVCDSTPARSIWVCCSRCAVLSGG